MKLFRLLFMAAAAVATVYVLSSFPVPAFAEQAIFSSQAAVDAVAPLQAKAVIQVVVSMLALLIVLLAVHAAFSRRRGRAAPVSEFNGGFDDDYQLDAGIPRLRDPGPSG